MKAKSALIRLFITLGLTLGIFMALPAVANAGVLVLDFNPNPPMTMETGETVTVTVRVASNTTGIDSMLNIYLGPKLVGNRKIDLSGDTRDDFDVACVAPAPRTYDYWKLELDGTEIFLHGTVIVNNVAGEPTSLTFENRGSLPTAPDTWVQGSALDVDVNVGFANPGAGSGTIAVYLGTTKVGSLDATWPASDPFGATIPCIAPAPGTYGNWRVVIEGTSLEDTGPPAPIIPSSLTLSGLPASVYVGDKFTLTPSDVGGTNTGRDGWEWDEEFFSATFNSPATFTALKAGKTTISYTALGQNVTVDINILAAKSNGAANPGTADSFSLILYIGILSLCILAITMATIARRKKIQ